MGISCRRPVRIGLHPPPRTLALPESSRRLANCPELAGLCGSDRSWRRPVLIGRPVLSLLSLNAGHARLDACASAPMPVRCEFDADLAVLAGIAASGYVE